MLLRKADLKRGLSGCRAGERTGSSMRHRWARAPGHGTALGPRGGFSRRARVRWAIHAVERAVTRGAATGAVVDPNYVEL
jgi:hypothetical protein